MGDSSKSSHSSGSGTEEEEEEVEKVRRRKKNKGKDEDDMDEISRDPKRSKSKRSPKFRRGTLELTTGEAKNFISTQLQQQVELTISKALQSTLFNHLNGPDHFRNNSNNFHQQSLSPILPDFNNSFNQQQPSSTAGGGGGRCHSTPNPVKRGLDDDDDSSEVSSTSDEVEEKGTPREPIGIVLFIVQFCLIVLFGFLVSYDKEQVGASNYNVTASGQQSLMLPQYYSQYQDIQVMIFLGIGVLMSFLRKYGYSSIGFSLLAGTIAVQWGILVRGLIHSKGAMIELNITNMIFGDFAAAVVLITYGVIIGIASPCQLIFMTLVEVVFYLANEYIGTELFHAVDTGGSIFVHIFAAYFGLGMSRGMMPASSVKISNLKPSHTSNITSLVAVIFLWLFWPSFNSVFSTGPEQHRVVLNTMLALFGSCVSAFIVSALFNANKFNVGHIQNASLAGGVAVGAVVDLLIRPWGALLIGCVGGLLAVLGIDFVSPFFSRVLGIHDSCGVHSLHGLPGVFAGLVGVIMAAVSSEQEYGPSLYLRYPARAPEMNSTRLLQLQQINPDIGPGLDRSAAEQAMYQLAAVGMTLLVSFASGVFTGWLMRIPIFSRAKGSWESFNDGFYFLEDEPEPKKKKKNKIIPTNAWNSVSQPLPPPNHHHLNTNGNQMMGGVGISVSHNSSQQPHNNANNATPRKLKYEF